jgi:hypothetical protein
MKKKKVRLNMSLSHCNNRHLRSVKRLGRRDKIIKHANKIAVVRKDILKVLIYSMPNSGISTENKSFYLPQLLRPTFSQRRYDHLHSMFSFSSSSTLIMQNVQNKLLASFIYQPNCCRKSSTPGPSFLMFLAALCLTFSIICAGPQAAMAILSPLSVWLTMLEIKAGISGRPCSKMRDLDSVTIIGCSGHFSMSTDELTSG